MLKFIQQLEMSSSSTDVPKLHLHGKGGDVAQMVEHRTGTQLTKV